MVELIIILYFVGSGIVLRLIYPKSLREWLLAWSIAAFVPVIGWLFPVCWPGRKRNRPAVEEVPEIFNGYEDDPEIHRDSISPARATDMELHVVPIEEALLISDHKDRRSVMINVLKQDSIQYMDVLQKAVNNEDTETSHYAVSAIMEIKRKLTISMQDLAVQYETNKMDPEVLKAYADVLHAYMKSGFLDNRTLRKYKFTYVEVLDNLISVSPDMGSVFEAKVETEIELNKLLDAEQTSLLYMERHPHSEEAYLCLLKVYFYMRASGKLKDTLDMLKSSTVRLSNHGLTLVRFWSKGA